MVFLTIMLLAFLGNLLVIISVLRTPSLRRQKAYYFVVSLAVAGELKEEVKEEEEEEKGEEKEKGKEEEEEEEEEEEDKEKEKEELVEFSSLSSSSTSTY